MAVVTSDRAAPASRTTQATFSIAPRCARPSIRSLLVVALRGPVLHRSSHNTAANLRKQNIASGFGFIDRTAGFDVSQSLIDFNSSMTYGRAFLVGLLNTLLVAGLGIVLATVIGLHHRHRAALQQLAGRPPRHRLRRGHPQRAAAAAAVLLVFRGAEEPAGAAAEPTLCRAAASSTCAASICRRRCPSPASTRWRWRS